MYRLLLRGIAALRVLGSACSTLNPGANGVNRQVVTTHDLDASVSLYHRIDGSLIAMEINPTDHHAGVRAGVSVADTSIQRFNATAHASAAQATAHILWLRDLPNRGAVYNVAIGDTLLGFLMRQPSGGFSYADIGRIL